jgi:hypothetical protein
VVLAGVETWISPSPDLPLALKVTLGLALEGAFLWLALRAVSPERGDG